MNATMNATMNALLTPQQPKTSTPQAVYAILNSPPDHPVHPGKWVVQLWNPTPVGYPLAIVDGLFEARAAILDRHPAAERWDRQTHDAPEIVETWA